MPFPLLPKLITDELTDLTPEILKANHVRLLMLDFDNTIVPYTTSVPTEEMDQWLKAMVQSQVTICVVSNSHKDRVKIFCEKYGIPCITHAKKPFSRGIRQCLAKFELAPGKCALAGDQIFTDTLGGNGCNVRTILVRAIHNHTIWLRLRHVLELPFIFLAGKRRVDL